MNFDVSRDLVDERLIERVSLEVFVGEVRWLETGNNHQWLSTVGQLQSGVCRGSRRVTHLAYALLGEIKAGLREDEEAVGDQETTGESNEAAETAGE